jgi:hypothetical protein
MKTHPGLAVFLLAITNLASPTIVYSQHVHQVGPYSIVDGKKNPELISDAIAYHLVFTHIANIMADPKSPAGQTEAICDAIGLSGKDRQQFAAVLNEYRSQQNLAIIAHNLDAEKAVANGKLPPSFVPERDASTQAVRDFLKTKLSIAGTKAVDTYVQSEKRNMKVTKHES